MSAAVGLIDTAPSDQVEVALNTSEIGTLGAPVLMLAVPLTSRAAVPPLVVFHSDTCGPDMVIVWSSPVASVSMTIPFTTLGT